MKQGILITGSTGFLGSYALAEILRSTDLPVVALVRAEDRDRAIERLWHALQLHLPDEAAFWSVVDRIVVVLGDLHAPGLGIAAADRDRIFATVDSVLHIAGSLNRKSARACFNTNLRGGLAVIRLARDLAEAGRLARFTNVSTAAVAGRRQGEVVAEDEAVQWDRSDYDPYARTKKFGELLATELLPPDTVLTLRPSSVLGDARHERCWITDMVVAFCGLAQLPLVPLDPAVRLDLVAGDWVGHGIARLHLDEGLRHDTYHLAMGRASCTGASLARALRSDGIRLRFAPALGRSFHLAMRGLDRMPRSAAQQAAAVMKVFWPYITNDVVFDGARAAAALGPPPPFEAIAPGMVRYARSVGLRQRPRPLLGREEAGRGRTAHASGTQPALPQDLGSLGSHPRAEHHETAASAQHQDQQLQPNPPIGNLAY